MSINWAELERSVNSQTASYFSSLPPPPPSSHDALSSSNQLSLLDDPSAGGSGDGDDYGGSTYGGSPGSPPRVPFGEHRSGEHRSGEHRFVSGEHRSNPSPHRHSAHSSSPTKSLHTHLLSTISESQTSIHADLQNMASDNRSNFSDMTAAEKENRSNISDLYSHQTSNARALQSLEHDVAALRNRQSAHSDSVDFCTSLTSKHQHWIHHADTLLTDSTSKHNLSQQQIMQLSLTVQGCASRVEVDATVGALVTTSKAQWKGMGDAFDVRVGEAERMQVRIGGRGGERVRTSL